MHSFNDLFILFSYVGIDRPLFVLTLLENIINTESSCVTTGDSVEYIECENSSSMLPACQVHVEHISVIKFGTGAKMTVTFNQNTNKPALLSTNAVKSVLALSPPVIGSIIGEWDETDSRILYLYIDYTYYLSILQSHDIDPTSIKVTGRKDPLKQTMRTCPNNTITLPNTIVGSKVFKISELGFYDVYILDMETMRVVNNVPYKSFQITSCDDVLFLPTFQGDSINQGLIYLLTHSFAYKVILRVILLCLIHYIASKA